MTSDARGERAPPKASVSERGPPEALPLLPAVASAPVARRRVANKSDGVRKTSVSESPPPDPLPLLTAHHSPHDAASGPHETPMRNPNHTEITDTTQLPEQVTDMNETDEPIPAYAQPTKARGS
jgi:hypothetical protein